MPPQDPIDTTLDVDLGKLIKLKLGILAQLLAFAREVRLLGVGLRADEHILAGVEVPVSNYPPYNIERASENAYWHLGRR
jgi:hypothetical protein